MRLHTESGDRYKIKVAKNISGDELEKILREKFPDEWEGDGPGFRGSYIHIEDDDDYQSV